MYQQFFGLNEQPFSIAVNPRYLFMSARHRDALAHLLYGVGSGGGFILLTGEVGTGKTTLCRTLEPSALAAAHRSPLAQQFVTRMMPAGHIKSSRSDDAPFLATMEASEKWLRVE